MSKAAGTPQGTGADRLLRAIADVVDVCFANPGTTEMWLVSALDNLTDSQGNLAVRPVLCLHETVCAGAADGYARMRQRPAMALLHLGPGLCNALANLHNARRARSPVLCLVGDMASWHVHNDPLLAMDIDALAATVSSAVVRPMIPDATTDSTGARWDETTKNVLKLLSHTADASHPTHIPGWQVTPGVPDSRVVTLIVPHDLSWDTNDTTITNTELTVACKGGTSGVHASPGADVTDPEVLAFISQCGAALKATPRGKAALYLGGAALLKDNGALHYAGLIAAACGAVLLCENAFARIDRGAGLPHVNRLPYFPQEAAKELSQYGMIVTVDVKQPVANFGYADAPTTLLPPTLVERDAVWELDCAGQVPGGVGGVLRALAHSVCGPSGHTVTPGVNCGGVFMTTRRPPVPAHDVRLSPAVLCQCVAALQPEGCILLDESLTSGGPYWELSKACPPFSHLTLTGGAIGSGPPLALGAALACPDRLVINLQADGSAMYSLQALWSQAREGAKVITIVCANNTYNILKIECARQRVPSVGAATRRLTDLSQPVIDWVALAQGQGVRARRAVNAGELCDALREGLEAQGPFLVHAVL